MKILLAKRFNFEDPLINQHHIQIKLKREMRGRILAIIFSDQILKKMQLFLVGFEHRQLNNFEFAELFDKYVFIICEDVFVEEIV